MSPLAERIKKLRLALGHTQASLASAIGGKTTHTRVSEWENDKVEPERGTLMLIAQAARVKYDPARVLVWLQDGGEMPPESVYGSIRPAPEPHHPPDHLTVTELDRAILDLDRARTTLAQLRATLGIRSETGETAPDVAALPSAADTIRHAGKVPGTPSQPPGQAQGGNG